MNDRVYLFLDQTVLLILPGTRNEPPHIVQVTVETRSGASRVEDLAAYYLAQTEILEIILRIINYELLATVTQRTSSATRLFSNITEKGDYQEHSCQALEGDSIALPGDFVVEGASYHLIARKYPWEYGQRWNFFYGGYSNERVMLAAQSKWRFTFEPRTGDNPLGVVQGLAY